MTRQHLPAGLALREYGHLPDGRVVHEATLSDGAGLVLRAITLGGIVTRLEVPDREGEVANVVAGFADLADYVERNPHFGVIVGRYANRIAGAAMEIDGQRFELDRNDGPNTLHGGARGWGKRLWEIESAQSQGSPSLVLRYVSADGEEGFPGRVEARVTYALAGDRTWVVDYEARTDKPTVVNMSHHDYFNLAGGGSAMGHVLTLPASRFTAIDRTLIPTGIADVEGTPLDFRAATPIGARIGQPHEQLALAGGYDHNWILDEPANGRPRFAARLEDPASGRVLLLETSEPALQFYSGNFLDGSLRGPEGQAYEVKVTLPHEKMFGYGDGGGVRKEDTALRDRLNEALKAVRASGEYDAITKRYFDFDIYGD